MRVHLIVSEGPDGSHALASAWTTEEIDDHPERYAAELGGMREEVASDLMTAARRWGVVQLDIPGGDIEAAFARTEQPNSDRSIH